MHSIHKKYIFKSIKNITISDPELLVRFASKIDPSYHFGTRGEVEDYEAMVSRSIRSLVRDNPEAFKAISGELPRLKYLAPILKEAMLDRQDPAEVDSLLKIGFPVYFDDFSIARREDIEIEGYKGVIDWAVKNSHYQVLETHLQNYRLRYDQLIQEDIPDNEKGRMIFDGGQARGTGARDVEFTRDRFVSFHLAFQKKNLNAMRLFVRYAPDEVLVHYFTPLLSLVATTDSPDDKKFFSDLFEDQGTRDKVKKAYERLMADVPSYLEAWRMMLRKTSQFGLRLLGKV
ncbi:MAG: hypothetical protein HYX41_05750 [Bdellovibrio sp.]|nr:hypothetical protein [Bdellovibrio sp.]